MNADAKCCGTCKWLDVPADKVTKRGAVTKRADNTVFPCVVPFDMPAFPASIQGPSYFGQKVKFERRPMCPNYGKDCAFHERRIP